MQANEEKKQCLEKIEELLENHVNGFSRDRIIYILTKKYAVSELSIKKRINLLLGLGIIELDGEVYKWVHPKKETEDSQGSAED